MVGRLLVAAVAAAGLVCTLCTSSFANGDDNKAIISGVSEIASPGYPGPLCLYGKNAFTVVSGKNGKMLDPVVAASMIGKGRVVAFGHDGYFGKEALSTADTGKLVINSIRWAAGTKTNLRVGVYHQPELFSYLKANGIAVEEIQTTNWSNAVDVLCLLPWSLDSKQAYKLASFVQHGGGAVVAALGWGWLDLNPGKTLDECTANRFLRSAGMIWTDGYLDNTGENGFKVGDASLGFCNASRAIDALADYANGKVKLTEDEAAQAAWTVSQAITALPLDNKDILPKLQKLAAEHKTEVIPTEKDPLTLKKPLDRLLLTYQITRSKNARANEVKAHPAAKVFPGEVPADAPRVEKTIKIDTSVPNWHSTGLYAAPGEVVTVNVPQSVTHSGLLVRIGAHTDTLWHLDSWSRVPEICRTFKLDNSTVRAANAFGGPVYIVVPDKCSLKMVEIGIKNAVEAPRYVLGKTSIENWKSNIRSLPAPWAELETSKVIITLPSSAIRTLDDPEDLMKFWDRVMDACADLATWPRERKRPERYATDAQISAGYMHSGYPIMTFLDAVPLFVDKASMMKAKMPTWGFFHEMGHDHQSPDWNFDGVGEITVNLFTLYCLDTVCGISPDNTEYMKPSAREKLMAKYFAEKPSFKRFSNDPFLALVMYVQLQKAFGWDAYKQVFAEYRSLPDSEKPRTEDEKRDQWLVRMSKTVGKNLGPFFEAWGVPTSEKARTEVKSLPVWMPENFPPK